MKQRILLVSCLALLLLAGAGCSELDNTPPTTESKPAMSPETPGTNTSTSIAMEDDVVTDSNLTLSAEALGNGEVKLMWSVPKDTDTTDGFLVVRAKTENPVNDGKNYWYKMNTVRREMIWKGIPVGTHHMRLCVLDGEECMNYSNNVTVEVK